MTMPAGKYYIGDLCYVMHGEWNEFCDLTFKGYESIDGEFALKDGRRFASYRTAYGDGCYPCSNGDTLGVDAGLIGCIRVEDITVCDENDIEMGTVVEFDSPFSTYERDGTIYFGHISVETADEVDDEELDEGIGYEDEDDVEED